MLKRLQERVKKLTRGQAAAALVTIVVIGGALVALSIALINANSEISSLKHQIVGLQAENAFLRSEKEYLVGALPRVEQDLNRKANVVTWAFKQCRVSAEEIRRIDPWFVFPAGSGVVATHIGRPSENDQVPAAVQAEGKLCGSTPPKGSEIWIALAIAGIDGFYPQGSYRDHLGPVTIRSDNTWISPNLFLGGPSDRGRQVSLVAILANSQATAALWNYLRKADQTHRSPAIPLPPGATELTRVTVIRK